VKVGTGDQIALIENLIEPSIAAMGFELVRVQFMGGGGKTLQVMVERQDRQLINVDHCAEVSRMVSTLLEVENPVSSAYVLEVSSPGIDRPLVRIGDYSRFLGFEARIETDSQINGQRQHCGRIEGVDGELVQLDCGGNKADIPFQAILKASLVMTDELIEAAQREAQAAAQSDS
jgi:ribosome maturation factor RimP